MRIVIPLLAALVTLTPLALADHGGKTPHLDRNAYTVGPCTVGWSIYWPGDAAWATCAAAGHEIFYVAYGTGAIGWTCTVRVLDTPIATCGPGMRFEDLVVSEPILP